MERDMSFNLSLHEHSPTKPDKVKVNSTKEEGTTGVVCG